MGSSFRWRTRSISEELRAQQWERAGLEKYGRPFQGEGTTSWKVGKLECSWAKDGPWVSRVSPGGGKVRERMAS